MSTSSDVERMKHKWESLGIERDFPKVHHFSSGKFRTTPSGLKGFYNWCQDKEIQDENLQTVNRALKAASLVERGKNIDAAIDLAWDAYPTVKR